MTNRAVIARDTNTSFTLSSQPRPYLPCLYTDDSTPLLSAGTNIIFIPQTAHLPFRLRSRSLMSPTRLSACWSLHPNYVTECNLVTLPGHIRLTSHLACELEVHITRTRDSHANPYNPTPRPSPSILGCHTSSQHVRKSRSCHPPLPLSQ